MDKANNMIRAIRYIENSVKNFSAFLLFILMLLGTSDVIGRSIFNRPILGAVEISKMLVMSMVVLCWAYTQFNRGHITVKYITERMPTKIREITYILVQVISAILFALITWQAIMVGIESWEEGKVFAIINLPIAILHFIVSFGALLIFIEILLQLIEALRNRFQEAE